MGAVMAAFGITAHLGTAAWRGVAERQLVPGGGRDRFVFQRQFVQAPDEPVAGGYVGFSVPDYAADSAVVGILIRRDEGYLSTYIAMKWRDGDWEIAPKPDGSLYSPLSPETTSDGFIPWGA